MADKSVQNEPIAEMPKGSSWLEEVKKDAERITLKRIKDAEEERKYQDSKKENEQINY